MQMDPSPKNKNIIEIAEVEVEDLEEAENEMERTQAHKEEVLMSFQD